MPELTPRVVFDCNLFVQGIANRNSPARKALRLFFSGDISLFVSEPPLCTKKFKRARTVSRKPGSNSEGVCKFQPRVPTLGKAVGREHIELRRSSPLFSSRELFQSSHIRANCVPRY